MTDSEQTIEEQVPGEEQVEEQVEEQPPGEEQVEEQVEEQPTGEERATGASAPGDDGAPGDSGALGGAAGTDAAGPDSPAVCGEVGVGDDQVGEDATEIEDDLDELVDVAAQRDEYLALAQRTQADFENYRKRVARESATAAERGVAKLAKELLPALDNLDRALDAAARDDPLLDGVRLVRAELSSGLGRLGIESFGAAGDTFDPAEHEAVAQQPVEGAASGSVVEVYQPGYRLGANVIRPARVLVAA
jgi:molecular chaperone GrpE